MIDRLYDVMKSAAQDLDCRFAISQLPTHGFNIRILARKTQVIERLLGQVQDQVVKDLFDREAPFLRKY